MQITFKNIIKMLIILIIIFLIYIYAENNFLLFTKKYIVKSDKISQEFNGFKILQISDLHSNLFGEENKALKDKINRIEPNVLVVTGDVLNANNDDGNVFISLVKSLDNKYPVYYIDGNHEQILEYYNKDIYNNFIKNLKENNVIILDNKKIQIKNGDAHINLYGLDIPIRYYSSEEDLLSSNDEYSLDIMNKALSLSNIDNNDFNILLVHNPLFFDIYVNSNVDLIFSGHVHGGIVNVPYKGGLVSPNLEFYPKYYNGLYKKEDTTMIVSPGMFGSDISYRLFNPAKLMLVELKTYK